MTAYCLLAAQSYRVAESIARDQGWCRRNGIWVSYRPASAGERHARIFEQRPDPVIHIAYLDEERDLRGVPQDTPIILTDGHDLHPRWEMMRIVIIAREMSFYGLDFLTGGAP